MAVQVSQTLKELQQMCAEYGIEYTPSGKNGKLMKEDMIYPIRDFFLIKRYGSLDNIPWHMKMMLEIKSPMLAKRIDAVKEEIQQKVWSSDDWYFEDKLNGARMLIPIKDGEYHLYSRHNSDVDFLPIEYTDKILMNDHMNLKGMKGTYMIDTEMTSDRDKLNTVVGKYGVVTETMLQAVSAIISSDKARALLIQRQENLRFTFNVFDCLYAEGEGWILEKPLIERRKYVKLMYDNLSARGMNIRPVRSNRSNKEQFYKSIILTGGEGVVAKNIYSTYTADTNRQSDGWLKIKRSMSEMSEEGENKFGDTIDGWISGFEVGTEGKGLENYVATICISTFVRKADGTDYEHEIARISGMDMKLREDMTEIVEGQVTLKASYYNRVVEIDGAGVSARNKRLNHAVLMGFRYDKDKMACIIEEEFLNKMVL